MTRSDKVKSDTPGRAPQRSQGRGVRLQRGQGKHPAPKEASGSLASLSTHFLCRFGLLEIMTPHQSLVVPRPDDISA